MLAPLQGWLDREVVGVFKVAVAMASGLAVVIDNSANTAPLNPSPYANSFGQVKAASPAQTITQSGTTPFAVTAVVDARETGWLLQPVTASGPSLLSVLSQVYDESVAAGGTAAVLPSKAGALIGTDQYVTAGGAAIKFDGTVALGAICGINNGQPRLVQAGDAGRLQFMGKVSQRLLALATFQII